MEAGRQSSFDDFAKPRVLELRSLLVIAEDFFADFLRGPPNCKMRDFRMQIDGGPTEGRYCAKY